MKKFLNARHVFLLLCLLCLFGTMAVYNIARAQKQGRTFGLVCMTMTNEFYEVIETELSACVQANNDTLITLDPQLDLKKQKEQIYWLIDQEVDGLFINPIDSTALVEPIQEAWNHNIPVVILDAPLCADTAAISTVASDNAQAGALCAQDLLERVDSANILLLQHSTVESARERIESFKKTLEECPAYQIVSEQECMGQLEQAMPAVEKALTENPEIDVIMALNDPSAMGALAALEALNRTDIKVYGVDGTPDVKKQLASDSCMTATAAQSPITIAKYSAEAMYEWLEKGTCQKEQILPVELITRENIAEWSLTRWQ